MGIVEDKNPASAFSFLANKHNKAQLPESTNYPLRFLTGMHLNIPPPPRSNAYRQINGGKDLPREFLEGVFTSIKANEIQVCRPCMICVRVITLHDPDASQGALVFVVFIVGGVFSVEV